jgi:hypothetical protein
MFSPWLSAEALGNEPVPSCLQDELGLIEGQGVEVIVVIESRSPGSTVDSATDVWRHERPDLLLWVGPDGAHILARWLSYGESRSLVRTAAIDDVCDYVGVLRRAAGLRWRTVTRLSIGLMVGLIGLALVWFRAPRPVQNSK